MIKRKWDRKCKIPRTVLERRTLSFSSYKNLKLKIKFWWLGARKRKKRAIFVLFILSKGNHFLTYFFISMYSVINTLSEYTYFYVSKNITSYIFCLFLKSPKAFSVFLIWMPHRNLSAKLYTNPRLVPVRRCNLAFLPDNCNS